MTRYTVALQNASGHRLEITVDADTDTRACTLAIGQANTYRAISALALDELCEIAVVVDERAADVPVLVAPAGRGPKVIHRAGPADWVRDHRGETGNLGVALRDAYVTGGGGSVENV